jgi:urease accessory protein
MMIIKQKLGTLGDFVQDRRIIDRVELEWYETNKRILHKKTLAGREIVLKFLKEQPLLTEDDVVYEDTSLLIVVLIKPCEVIAVRPSSLYQMASLCYEIGNKHLPLFYEKDEVLVPYETPVFNLLTAAGFDPIRTIRKLLYPLKTSVIPHHHSGTTGLFSKILQLTTPAHE